MKLGFRKKGTHKTSFHTNPAVAPHLTLESKSLLVFCILPSIIAKIVAEGSHVLV